MATVEETTDAAEDLAGGSSLLDIKEVMRESYKKRMEEINGMVPTEEELETALEDAWNNSAIRQHYQLTIAQIDAAYLQVSEGIKQIPTTFAAITAAQAVPTASAAAIPQLTSIKTMVLGLKAALASALSLCVMLGIGAPAPLYALVAAIAPILSLVGL